VSADEQKRELPSSALAEYVRDVVSVMRWRVALAIALMAAVGFTEGLGVLLLIPLLQLTGLDIQQGAAARLVSFVSAAFHRVGLTPTLPVVLAVFAGVMTLEALLTRWQTIVNRRLEFDFASGSRRSTC
jgi:ATP-binding cassette subfamily C protein